MKIAQGVEMLEISANIMGMERTIHPVLIWDGEHAILVDAGFPGQLALIRAAVEQAGVAFDRINGLILTHHDIDHIGSAAAVQKALPGGVIVLAHEVEKDYIEGLKRPLKLAQMEANLSTLPDAMRATYQTLNTAFQNSRVRVARTLADGEVLPYRGGITVVATPGHTLGHICLYLQELKTLVAGDALTVENGTLAMSPPALNYDPASCKESLKKLAHYDIETVICYHGGLYQDHPNQRIADLSAA